MKNVISRIVIFFALLLFVTLFHVKPCRAQASLDSLRSPTTEEKVEAISRRMERELSLTPVQLKQVNALLRDRFVSATSGQTIASNRKALARIESILTEEQKKRFGALREERANQKAEFLRRNPGYKFSQGDQELDL